MNRERIARDRIALTNFDNRIPWGLLLAFLGLVVGLVALVYFYFAFRVNVGLVRRCARVAGFCFKSFCTHDAVYVCSRPYDVQQCFDLGRFGGVACYAPFKRFPFGSVYHPYDLCEAGLYCGADSFDFSRVPHGLNSGEVILLVASWFVGGSLIRRGVAMLRASRWGVLK